MTLMSIIHKTQELPSDQKLAVVLLAAGEGSRLGFTPKALLTKNGVALLQRFCSVMADLKPIEFIVITGFHSEAIESELAMIRELINTPITVKHNIKADQGQGSSVRLAIESLSSDYEVLAMCLSDQPHVGLNEMRVLLEEFKKCGGQEGIVMPMVGPQRGNPVLFSRRVIDEILSSPGLVCRTYMDQHPNAVKIFNTDNLAYIQDIDTQEDVLRLKMNC